MTMELVRLNVNLNRETADALNASASRSGVTRTEAIRRAVSLLAFIESEIDAGRVIQTMDAKGGDKRELVLM